MSQVCNLGKIIKDHMPLLLQVFNDDLKEYSMMMLTSKCLNTAVMMFYLYLGDEAFTYTRRCNVSNILTMHVQVGVNSLEQVKNFKYDLLNIGTNQRELFYVMITDGKVEDIDTGLKQSFPGHVFVIEKIPQKGDVPTYMMYQSYIRSYKLNDHYKMNNLSLVYTYANMVEFANRLQDMFTNRIWNEETSQFWLKFIHVDESRFINHNFDNIVHFCYQVANVSSCAKVLKEKILSKKKEIGFDFQKYTNMHVTFVDARDGDYPIRDAKTLQSNIDILVTQLDGKK